MSEDLLTRVLDLERARGYQVAQQARMNLNLVPQSAGAPHLTFAVKSDLPSETKTKLTEALLNAHKDSAMKNSYFKRTGFPNFEAASLKDYDSVKKLLADSRK